MTAAYVLPSTVVLAFFPSMTTSIVVPMFSNSAASTAGKLIVRAPGATNVVDVFVTSIGDCCVLVAHAEFSTARPAQPVLKQTLVNLS